MHALSLTALVDTIIVDGGSTDGSLAEEFLRSVGLRALLTKLGPGKLSAQLRCGYAWALLAGYEGIITIDGNGKDGVETIPDFIAALDDGYGYVQASRFIRGGRSENTPLIRLLAIRLLHAPLLELGCPQMVYRYHPGLSSLFQRLSASSGCAALPRRVRSLRASCLSDGAGILSSASRLRNCRRRGSTRKARRSQLRSAALANLLGSSVVVFRVLFGAYHPSDAHAEGTPGMTSNDYDVVIVGGGFYGCCLALFLRSVTSRILVVEAGTGLLERASRVNQARIHTGFHYPRSFTTAMRSRALQERFMRDFKHAVVSRF